MKNQENKISVEREVNLSLSTGKSQKNVYDSFKNKTDDPKFIDKVTDYLPNEIKEKNKYFNYFIMIFLLVNVILNLNILNVIISFILYFFLKEMSGWGYRALLWIIFLNIIFIFFTADMVYFTYIRIGIWILFGLTDFIFYKKVFKNKTITGKTKRYQNGDYIFID